MVDERAEPEVDDKGTSLIDAAHLKRLCELRTEVEDLKQSLAELVHKKRAISTALTSVVEGRARVCLRRRAYEEGKNSLRAEYEELQQVAISNQRRDDRLARVRGKDFTLKLEKMESECEDQRRKMESKRERLEGVRRQLVVAVQSSVFPVQVEPLSEDDAGEEDYLQASVIDCDTVMDVDDGWLLSGVHQSPMPHATIITASLPLDGDYSAYIDAAEERRKKLKAASERGAPLPPVTCPGSPPLSQPYLAVPAGLQFTAQLIEIVADLLDTPLPHPLHRPLAVLEYGNQNKQRRCFLDSVAKLDDNIVYLCFSQNVPLSALSAGHTLSNLLALVTHTELGRQGAFECHPDLATYRGDGGGMRDPENEPPSFYTADLPPGGLGGENSDSEVEREVEGEREEWERVEMLRGEEVARFESSCHDYISMGISRETGLEERGQTQSEEKEVNTAGMGLFGTLSSLLSSTFSRSTS